MNADDPIPFLIYMVVMLLGGIAMVAWGAYKAISSGREPPA